MNDLSKPTDFDMAILSYIEEGCGANYAEFIMKNSYRD